ncbi:ceramidase [Flavobacteriaceae bacterium TK19130]|nr:ceramidase [Thermobacterium salinum]
MILFHLLQQFPSDSGPIYKETVEGRIPVEPFNTFSNFLFLAVFLYFAFKVYRNYKTHRFLAYTLPVLFICFVGGTIYHATRSAEIWLLLDWVPIVLLTFSVSVYFIFKSVNTTAKGLLFTLGILVFVFGVRQIPGTTISIGYLATAVALLLPLIIYSYQNQWKFAQNILWAVVAFALALSCRTLDNEFDILHMGTHWLWHSFGAISVFFLMRYLFLDNEEIAAQKTDTA